MTSIVNPEDLRPGDRVRFMDAREPITVKRIEGELVISAKGECVSFGAMSHTWTRTWELIERPKPKAKLGSVWIDPIIGRDRVKFVALDDGLYVSQFGTRYNAAEKNDARLIARLVPDEEES